MTTSTLALSAACAAAGSVDEVLLVEADPAGGDLECWCGPHGEPGLVRVVTDVGRGGMTGRLQDRAVDVVEGVRAVLAPTSTQAMAATFHTASDGFLEAVVRVGGTAIVDLGRWTVPASSPAVGLVRQASVVVVVCRSALASIEHARALVAELRPMTRQVVVLMVGASRPYAPHEVASAVGVPVVGVMPWDPKGVGALVVQGAGRAWRRSLLATAANEVAERLCRVSAGRPLERVERAYG